MIERDAIPLVVGVTGHRNIRAQDRDTLYAAVAGELARLQSRCPHSQLILLNSLAEGADLLCAQAAADLGIPLMAALPMEQEAYERDFSPEALPRFRALCAGAEQTFVTPPAEPLPPAPDRDFFYRQAGIYVAAHAHVLLALWDGDEASPSPCGTAQTVRFMLRGDFDPADAVPLPGFGAVLHIHAPTKESDPVPAGQVRFLGEEAAFWEALDRTDEFNALAAGVRAESPSLLPRDREKDPWLDGMEALYRKADALSLRYARAYRRILGGLAVLSTLITFAFLLYDEAEWHGMILLCGLFLLGAWAVQRLGDRTASHRRYLEYRTLAEAMRVQAFLRYAGSQTQIQSILPWSQKTETGWVAGALKACALGMPPYAAHSVRDSWVEQQRQYHLEAKAKSARTLKGSDRVVSWALGLSILVYGAVLVFEFVWGDLNPFSGQIPDAERYRTVSKLLLGGISAATLFISNYYGRLSLSRVRADHEKMARFYEAVAARMDRFGESEALLCLLAREELVENGNWCAYQRENGADFTL